MFFDDVDVHVPQLLLFILVVRSDMEGSHGNLRRENHLSAVYQEEGSLPGGSAWRGAVSPKHARELEDPVGTVLSEAAVGACLEAPEDLSVCTLSLTITPWVSY